jgi:taurine--2-oxoglutarate transaminase
MVKIQNFQKYIKYDFMYLLRPWMKSVTPLFIKKGKGCYLIDINNNKYFDFSSGLFNVNLGYNNKEIIQSIYKQLKMLPYLSPHYSTATRSELAFLLIKLNKFNFSKCFICSGGSEAVETAIKIIKEYTKKSLFICQKEAYHGSTFGANILSYSNKKNKSHDIKTIYIEPPSCFRCRLNSKFSDCNLECINKLKTIIKKYKNRIAAVFIEPIIGIGGFIIPPKEYLPMIREICDENNILLAFDEILTGFGRTGKWFAYQHYKVIPDILCLSKGMNSGYLPIGATLISKDLAEWIKENPIEYGYTNMAHPVSCASALATIKYIKKHGIIRKVKKNGNFLLKLCKKIYYENWDIIKDVRGKGLLVAIEFKSTKKLKFKMVNFLNLLFKKRILVHVDPTKNILPLLPPLTVTEKELEKNMEKIGDCIYEFRKLSW